MNSSAQSKRCDVIHTLYITSLHRPLLLYLPCTEYSVVKVLWGMARPRSAASFTRQCQDMDCSRPRLYSEYD